MGVLLHLRLPGPLAQWSIQIFSRIYGINTTEAEKSLSEYQSIGEFFTRKLKPEARPIARTPLVHPADSVITQIGQIRRGQLIQAKGMSYSMKNLLQDPQAEIDFEGGLFATYYLCPTDYHRVHSPVSGVIESVTHVPGRLWPVNSWGVSKIPNLFCVNERVIVEISTAMGSVRVVFVGATNVGKITMSFEPQIVSNQGHFQESQKITYNPGRAVKKGDELGVFHMGSTVIFCATKMVYSLKDPEKWEKFQSQPVKMGESLL